MAFTAFKLCMRFASTLIWQFLDPRDTHALHAVAWIAHAAVPDDTPAAESPALVRASGALDFWHPISQWAYGLTFSDRTAFQATEWWNHSDLRRFTQGLGVVPASDSDSASVATFVTQSPLAAA